MRVAFCLLLLVWLGIRQKPRIFQKINCWGKRVWKRQRERRRESFWVSSVWGSYSWETGVEFFLHVCCLQEFVLPFEALWGVKAPQTQQQQQQQRLCVTRMSKLWRRSPERSWRDQPSQSVSHPKVVKRFAPHQPYPTPTITTTRRRRLIGT
jgi:hypothetical protein